MESGGQQGLGVQRLLPCPGEAAHLGGPRQRIQGPQTPCRCLSRCLNRPGAQDILEVGRGDPPSVSACWGSACGHCSLLFNQRGFSWETVAGSLQTSLPAPPSRLPSAASRQLGSQSAHTSCPAWHGAPRTAPCGAGWGGLSPAALRASQPHKRAPAPLRVPPQAQEKSGPPPPRLLRRKYPTLGRRQFGKS